jgi:hypothetical protein
MSKTFVIENAECIAETDLAILVEAPDLEEDTWVPKSQVKDESDVKEKGDSGDLCVSQWFAGERGWV